MVDYDYKGSCQTRMSLSAQEMELVVDVTGLTCIT